jgi:hypothetical protein
LRITPAEGGVRVRLDAAESDTLASLVADLVAALRPDGLAPDDPVRLRLFPDGYQDNPDAAAAFRELTEHSLREERLGRAQQCLAELADVSGSRRRRDITLPGSAAQRWLQVLNDMRLAMGTRLGVTEDSDLEDVAALDPTDPGSMAWALYTYLTAVQDSLVRALMRGA